MKALVIAAVAAALACGSAAAQTTTKSKTKETTGQSSKSFKQKRGGGISADGYYRPGIPKRDAGRYNNLGGKDADYSKAYIQDH